MKTTAAEKSLTTAEFAAKCNVKIQTVWSWVRHGCPHSYQSQPRRRRRLVFLWSQVAPWLELRGAATGAPIPAIALEETAAVAMPGADTGPTRRTRPTPATPFLRVCDIEVSAFERYESVRAQGLPAIGAAKAYLESTRNLVEASHAVHKSTGRKSIRAEIVAEVLRDTANWLKTFRALVDPMPSALAERCNPAEPTRAKDALQDWVENQISPVASVNRLKTALAR